MAMVEAADLNSHVYARLVKSSNLDRLLASGLHMPNISEVWFTCPECKQPVPLNDLFLIRIDPPLDNKLPVNTAGVIQNAASFFVSEGGDRLSGLDEGMLIDLTDRSAIISRCRSCTSESWLAQDPDGLPDFDLGEAAGDTETKH
jgi:hypothetical protein